MAKQLSSKGIMWATIIIAIVLSAIIFSLTMKQPMSAADAAAADEDQADIRIQPVARFELTMAAAPAADEGPKDGQTIYNSVCGACHNTGVAGAPKMDAKSDWAPRIATGTEALYASVLHGKNAMPPKGGATNLSDDEIKGAVDYILSHVK
ncbi:MAG: c-type cytochrome [Azonexus sp.]|jgi:cytochrome c5|uniref:c-type cytochrome n=1 Tax=Azonexus sp. TaxID=1872668 RepID=UPI00282CA922|nr:c-type cytochrome [Azonexus sp.]MDR0775924.1 c-type cytochrome [Azonexus sp.]